ncbi:methyltransferase [Thermoascus aurantiacus ATCC 26904]
MTDNNPPAAAPAAEPAAEQDGGQSDTDSAVAFTIDGSDITSITSSIKNYNGRRYHSYREGEYVLPNDEQEQDRLDLSHHIYKMLLGGELYLAPIPENPQRVLDLGTGTGIWAIEFADLHPTAEVLGNDLSPIQPSWVPTNCKFEIDDFEADWTYTRKFDFIHGRELEGSVHDYDRLFKQCFDNLRPGGYLEMQSIEVATYSDDGSHLRSEMFLKGLDLVTEASIKFGKSMRTMGTWKEKMKQAGFVNVTEKIYKLPQKPWPDDLKQKELGLYHQANILEGLGSYAYALFSRVLHWNRLEIEVLLAGIRREIRDVSIHSYTNVYFVYGQKPKEQPREA